jgi:isoaspartyl peptidase/L-asparaginase-like protein (Ntn-hydrolase superfamily)
MFMRAAAAAQVAFRVRIGGESLARAAASALDEVRTLGGEGGLIAVNAAGEIVMPYNSAGMKRAALYADGTITCDVF